MEYKDLLKSIERMSPEFQCQLMMDMGRICEPNAEKIGACLSDLQKKAEPMFRFITGMFISYDRQFNSASDVDVLDDSVSGVLVGVSFNNGLVAAWTTEGCKKLSEWVMPQVEQKYYEANSFKRIKVA